MAWYSKEKYNSDLIRIRLLRRVQRVTGASLGLVIALTIVFFTSLQYMDMQREAHDQAGFAAEALRVRLVKDASDLQALASYFQALIRENPDGGISAKDRSVASSMLNAFLKSRDGHVLAIGLAFPRTEPIFILDGLGGRRSPGDLLAAERLQKAMMAQSSNAADGFNAAEIQHEGNESYVYTFSKKYLFAEGKRPYRPDVNGNIEIGIVSSSKLVRDSFVNLGVQVKRRGLDVEYRILESADAHSPSSSMAISPSLAYSTVDGSTPLANARRGLTGLTFEGKPIEISATIVSDDFVTRQLSIFALLIFGSFAFFVVIRRVLSRGVDAEVGPLQKLGTDLQQVVAANFETPVTSSGSAEVREIAAQIESMRGAMLKYLGENKKLSQMAAIANMTQMLAHDVRKPFSMLKMGLGMLSRAKEPADVKKILSRLVPEIDKAVSSVDGLISDVMEIGSSSTALIQEPISPEALIESTLGEIFRVYPKAEIILSYSLNHTQLVNVHVQKVGRVFSNIFGNAVQAMSYNGRAWFKTRDVGGFIEFCLGNAGSMIPTESLPKLFEAFFTSGKKGGTGLGLAIAEKVVKAHGGRIWCESGKTTEYPDGYVEFKFTLPVSAATVSASKVNLPSHSAEITKAIAALNEAATASQSSIGANEVKLEAEIERACKALGRSLRVLIVDDEEVYRQALATSLTRTPELIGSLVIGLVDSSDKTIELVDESPYDLVITDVDMGPDSLTGFELVERLRSIPGMAGPRCLICVHSNRIVAEDHRTAIERGADAFISKPASREQLLKLALQASQRAALSVQPLPSAPKPVTAKPEIAVIDDNPFILDAWKDILAADTVVYVADSPEAFLMKLESDPALLGRLACVVTDQNFDNSPEDGIGLGRVLKARRADIVILLSSDGEFRGVDMVGAIDRVIAKDPVAFESLNIS